MRYHRCVLYLAVGCVPINFQFLKMSSDTDTQVKELLPFLLHPSPQVVSLAIVNLLPFTVPSSPQRPLFLDEKAGPDSKGWLRVFAAVARSSPDPVSRIELVAFGVAIADSLGRVSFEKSIGKAALNVLVNLTDSVTIATKVASLPGFVQWLFTIITVGSHLKERSGTYVDAGSATAFHRIHHHLWQMKHAWCCRTSRS